jgi:hypothetical protein
MLGLGKCPDLIVNRGHYLGTDFRDPGEPWTPADSAHKRQIAHFSGIRVPRAHQTFSLDAADTVEWLLRLS